MSWQAYVDTNLVGSGKVTKAAILGQQGGVWASSPGFNLSADEQKAALKVFTDPTAAQASGLRLVGDKYFALQVDDKSFLGRKGGDGCIVVKTKQAILVAIYKAPIIAGEANLIVQGLADYLVSVGY